MQEKGCVGPEAKGHEISPWPGGVLGMLLGGSQVMASPSTLAGRGGDSPKRQSNSSSSVRVGRGLTDSCTCRRRHNL